VTPDWGDGLEYPLPAFGFSLIGETIGLEKWILWNIMVFNDKIKLFSWDFPGFGLGGMDREFGLDRLIDSIQNQLPAGLAGDFIRLGQPWMDNSDRIGYSSFDTGKNQTITRLAIIDDLFATKLLSGGIQ